MTGFPGARAGSSLALGLLLAACQPTIDTPLPAGASAYEAIGNGPAGEAASALRPGDEISVTVFGEPDLGMARILVDEGGRISLPLVGQVAVAGRAADDVERMIEAGLRRGYLRNPHVAVNLLKGAGGMVTVEGDVKNPGVHPIRPGHTLVSAMALAGSPLSTAKVSDILVYRTVDGRRMGGRFNLDAIREGRADDPAMRDGDVVVVGFSRSRGMFEDLLKLTPFLNTFVLLEDNNN